MPYNNISEETRKERSERAIAMNKEMIVDEETGLERPKFGGKQPGAGRPRQKRASEVIAEKVVTKANDYYDRLDDIALNGNDPVAITAIKELLGIEEKERQIALETEQNLDRLHRDELIILALDLIKETGIIGRGQSVVGEVEVIRDGEFTELNS